MLTRCEVLLAAVHCCCRLLPGLQVHTNPGDELLCPDNAHIYLYEGGGISFNSGGWEARKEVQRRSANKALTIKHRAMARYKYNDNG
jgi:threonine aldolase